MTKWLLRRIDLDPALVGDLEEQVHRGKSAAWLVRQVAWALLLDAGQTVLRNPGSVAGSIVLAWGTALAAQACIVIASKSAESAVLTWALRERQMAVYMGWTAFHAHLLAGGALSLALSGWVVARTASHREATLLLVFFSVLGTQLSGNFYWLVVPHLSESWASLEGWYTVLALMLLPCAVLIGGALGLVGKECPKGTS